MYSSRSFVSFWGLLLGIRGFHVAGCHLHAEGREAGERRGLPHGRFGAEEALLPWLEALAVRRFYTRGPTDKEFYRNFLFSCFLFSFK